MDLTVRRHYCTDSIDHISLDKDFDKHLDHKHL